MVSRFCSKVTLPPAMQPNDFAGEEVRQYLDTLQFFEEGRASRLCDESELSGRKKTKESAVLLLMRREGEK